MKARAVLAASLFLGLAGLIAARAAYLGLRLDPRLEELARRQFAGKVLARPTRGAILDRDGNAIAANRETLSLAANPRIARSRPILARLLSKSLSIPRERISARLGSKREFSWIKRHLTEADLASLRRWHLIAGDRATGEGLWLVRESQRAYPMGSLAGQVLGTVNVDSIGIEGVELARNASLAGRVRSVGAIRDALGRPAFMELGTRDLREPGSTGEPEIGPNLPDPAPSARATDDGEPVRLTIDSTLQFAVEQELARSVASTGSRSGQVLVMDPVTGEILAAALDPPFAPGAPGHAGARRARFLTDPYEPGSTLKPLVAAIGFDAGLRPSDRFHGENGAFKISGKLISEAESHEKFGWISVNDVIRQSSNVGAAKIALKLGAKRLWTGLRSLGLGEKTGIEFPGEAPGKLGAWKSWKPLTVANVGFGQGILVTPLQLARAYAAIFNGGWLVTPSLLLGVKTPAPRRVLSEKAARQALAALERAAGPDGTGAKAGVDGLRIAGKTGTAQTADPLTRAYSRTRYITSFAGGNLSGGRKLVALAILDGPKGSYYAADTTAPLFAAIMRATVGRGRILADGDSLRASAASPARQSDSMGKTPSAPIPSPAEEGKLPDLRGLSPQQALQALGEIPARITGSGFVLKQTPEPGTELARVREVLLELGDN